MNNGSEIGTRVKVAREHAGLSLSALAKRAGMSRAYVGLLEAGKIPAITVARLLRIAAATNTQLDQIISEAEYSPEQRIEQHTKISEDLVSMAPGIDPQVARTFVEGLLHLNREDQARVAELITELRESHQDVGQIPTGTDLKRRGATDAQAANGSEKVRTIMASDEGSGDSQQAKQKEEQKHLVSERQARGELRQAHLEAGREQARTDNARARGSGAATPEQDTEEQASDAEYEAKLGANKDANRAALKAEARSRYEGSDEDLELDWPAISERLITERLETDRKQMRRRL